MKKTILIITLVASTLLTKAQIYTSFYNFEHVNQNLMVNPSNPHAYRFTIGVPGASRISAHVTNTLFEAGSFFNDNSGNENLKNIIDNLDAKERLNLYQNADLIFAGFGVKNGYVSFGIQQESTLNAAVPGQFLKFLYYGNANENNGSINVTTKDFNVETLIQVNYHVGYQHYLLDSSLVVGGRFKYISGAGHFHFSNFNANIRSDIFEWKINTDIRLESSGYDYIEDFGDSNPIDFITAGNSGYGVDLGATYLLPKMKISATVLNMGSIKWNKNLAIYESKGEYIWDGADIDEEDQDIDFDEILDSLEANLGFNEISPYSYRSKLPMHILASYEYQVHPKHAFAVTYQGSVWNTNLYNNFGINYIGRYAKRFNLILGYSRLNGGLNNVAFGVSGALGPIQLYLMTDNAWGIYRPSTLSSTNVRIGLNIVFFDRPQEQPEEKVNQ